MVNLLCCLIITIKIIFIYCQPTIPINYDGTTFVDLNILHLNDFHARFEETNTGGGVCKDKNTCIGGFSRLYYEISKNFAKNSDTILLNAGDNFQGTLFYNIFKWNITQYFLNMLPFDATVLGNHEFDDGIKGIIPFMNNLKFPIVVSNINDTLEPYFQGLYKKSIVIERLGRKIGIIGVITKKTNEISSSGKLIFLDESESVNAEAERLVRDEGVFTNIVVSHSGYDVEKEMARKATNKISLIIGGHSHTFLYTGEPLPGPDKPQGPYPTIIQRDCDGKHVLVVQAAAYCKYLGNLSVRFDENGDVIDFVGKPIYLSNDIPQDSHINKLLEPWKAQIDVIGNEEIGKSLVTLSQSECYISECLLGNFITDVMVYSYVKKASNDEWTYAAVAIFNSGGIRTTINKGVVTYSDMITAQPFGNTFDVGEIQGKYIKEMFEYAFDRSYAYGRAYINMKLLQVSGLHLVLNFNGTKGSRVESIKIRCNKCDIPVYENLDMEKYYRVIAPSFLMHGGDGFFIFSNNIKNISIGPYDMDSFIEYFKEKSPVYEELDNRIIIKNGENNIKCSNLGT